MGGGGAIGGVAQVVEVKDEESGRKQDRCNRTEQTLYVCRTNKTPVANAATIPGRHQVVMRALAVHHPDVLSCGQGQGAGAGAASMDLT